MSARFIHLRVHSAYSMLEGAIAVKALPKLCRDAGMPAIGLADSANMFGALEFSEAAASAGVQPIHGCQLALDYAPATRPDETAAPAAPIVAYAQNETGYLNLMRLISMAYLHGDAEDPKISWDALAESAEGLILLSGGPDGPAGRQLRANRPAAARQTLARLAEIAPDRVYLEIHRHGTDGALRTDAEAVTEPGFLDIALKLDLPIVAINEIFFAASDMYEAHDAMLCIAEGAYVSQENRRRLTPEHAFKSADDMIERFSDLPEAIETTVEIAQRCAYRAQTRPPILPRFAEDEVAELRRLAREGLDARLGVIEAAAPRETYEERLDYELGIIEKMGFPGYFLIVADFIQWAKARDIPVGPGRGSGAGSLVAYALTITNLDPLRYQLLFERFLNPERVSMPDFDIDFCQDRRDEVISYVQEAYGRDRVAQIITFGKLQARAALRDVGRVLQMPFGQVDRLCKMVPNNPANPVTLAQAIADEPRLQEAANQEFVVSQMLDVAQKIEGLYRHASTHAAGVVIGDRPLHELTPMYRDPRSEMPATQFNMKWVELAGLVKFDFLGLKTLTVIQNALDLLKARGVEVDIDAIALDDPATYELYGRADTVAVFQVESSGMRDALRQLQPSRIEDIIALVALYRPGPMENIPKYCNVKQGREEPDYLHPLLKPILEETYGIIVYQEQVMQIAQVLANYSLGGADLLRRAMGKKIKEAMDAERPKFMKGAAENGIDEPKAKEVWDLLEKFANYGFNKSHAAAYALVSYQTAWLKANYPVEFMAAVMNLDMHNTDKLAIYRQELNRMRIELAPPDVNASSDVFSAPSAAAADSGDAVQGGRAAAGEKADQAGAEEAAKKGRQKGDKKAAKANTAAAASDEDAPPPSIGVIRYALGAVKNVGRDAMRAVAEERRAGGPYSDLFDLARRLDLKLIGKRALESLTRAGAFDSLEPNRRRVLESLDLLIGFSAAEQEAATSAQESLFAGAGVETPPPPLPVVADWSASDRLAEEAVAVGFYISGHPLDAYAEALRRKRVLSYAGMVEAMGGARRAGGQISCRLAAVVTGRQERKSQKGTPFAFVQLSDPTAVFEAVAFSEVLQEGRALMDAGSRVVLTVDAERDGDQVKLRLQGVQALDDVVRGAEGAGLAIHVDDAAAIDGVKTCLDALADAGPGSAGRRGLGAVEIVAAPLGADWMARLRLPTRYPVSISTKQALQSLPSVRYVEEL